MQEIKQLLAITQILKEKYKRNFTLDGKLVGDIGEVLAAEKYGLELLPEVNHFYDATEIATGRLIQIKASFRNGSYFPLNHIPDYFLSIHITEYGEIEELFNGPGAFLKTEYIEKRKLKSDGSGFNFSKGILQKLNKEVPENEKIKELRKFNFE